MVLIVIDHEPDGTRWPRSSSGITVDRATLLRASRFLIRQARPRTSPSVFAQPASVMTSERAKLRRAAGHDRRSSCYARRAAASAAKGITSLRPCAADQAAISKLSDLGVAKIQSSGQQKPAGWRASSQFNQCCEDGITVWQPLNKSLRALGGLVPHY
jgi:hypothetical protein